MALLNHLCGSKMTQQLRHQVALRSFCCALGLSKEKAWGLLPAINHGSFFLVRPGTGRCFLDISSAHEHDVPMDVSGQISGDEVKV